MKKSISIVTLVLLTLSLFALPAFADGNGNNNGQSGNGNANDQACWGQAAQVFAQTGAMGYHSSSQGQPRLGLANLADMLFEAGVIDAPTIQALGAFVSEDISACM